MRVNSDMDEGSFTLVDGYRDIGEPYRQVLSDGAAYDAGGIETPSQPPEVTGRAAGAADYSADPR